MASVWPLKSNNPAERTRQPFLLQAIAAQMEAGGGLGMAIQIARARRTNRTNETWGHAPQRLALRTNVANRSFKATGITAYLKNGVTLENAATMANRASTRTTQLYDRRCARRKRVQFYNHEIGTAKSKPT